jgi:hypothetical protein
LVRKKAPKCFNKFAYVPSKGASGGLFVGWNSTIFSQEVLHSSKFAITIRFIATHNAEEWVLTNIYGTCNDQDIHNFINWLNSLHFEDEINWMLIWDFNFYRSLQDRNREGDNMQDIMVFNEIISNLGLQEIPLKGKNYIGSNMRQDPLLEQLDWCFTSTNWISDYPNTLLLPMARTISDHTPCQVQIGTSIPKRQNFQV